MKRNKGITLIALVITIIILIILAAITINAVFGENGLILRAQEAKFKTEVSGIKDLVDVKRLEIEASNYLNEFEGDLSVYLNGLNNPEYIGLNKLVIDEKGKLAYNPGEFSSDPQKTWLHQIGIYAAESGEETGGSDLLFELAVVKLNRMDHPEPGEFLDVEGWEFVGLTPITGTDYLIETFGLSYLSGLSGGEKDWAWTNMFLGAIAGSTMELHITDPHGVMYILNASTYIAYHPNISEANIVASHHSGNYMMLGEQGEWTFRFIFPDLDIDFTMSYIVE